LSTVSRKPGRAPSSWNRRRKSHREALVAYDWFEALAALNLVFAVRLSSRSFYKVPRRPGNGDELTSLLLANLSD